MKSECKPPPDNAIPTASAIPTNFVKCPCKHPGNPLDKNPDAAAKASFLRKDPKLKAATRLSTMPNTSTRRTRRHTRHHKTTHARTSTHTCHQKIAAGQSHVTKTSKTPKKLRAVLIRSNLALGPPIARPAHPIGHHANRRASTSAQHTAHFPEKRTRHPGNIPSPPQRPINHPSIPAQPNHGNVFVGHKQASPISFDGIFSGTPPRTK